MQDFVTLRVASTRVEIDGLAKTVIFDVPDPLKETFLWRPGQHLSFRFHINGEEVRRSYSISSSSFAGEPLRITVKRVPKGLASNFINDQVQAGDTIEVAPPSGCFCLNPSPKARRTHYFFGAGSGITPLYAMVQSVIAHEPYSVCHLAYGNISEKTILLQGELSSLAASSDGRLKIHHIFSKPGWWSNAGYWRRGYIDADAIEALLNENPPYAQDVQYYVCGPGNMNVSVKMALMGLDAPQQRIHMESYGRRQIHEGAVEGFEAELEINLNSDQQTIRVQKNQTLLAAIREAGLNPPFSCQSGVCGTCQAKLKGGEIEMQSYPALDEADIKRGLILTCQSFAKSAKLKISYD